MIAEPIRFAVRFFSSVSSRRPHAASLNRHTAYAAKPTTISHSTIEPPGLSAIVCSAPFWSVRSLSPKATWIASRPISA